MGRDFGACARNVQGRTQWEEHLDYDALQPLSVEDSDRVRETVDASRILRCRWAYKDKNWPKRKGAIEDGKPDDIPWRRKSRLVIAGHSDPDLGVSSHHRRSYLVEARIPLHVAGARQRLV